MSVVIPEGVMGVQVVARRTGSLKDEITGFHVTTEDGIDSTTFAGAQADVLAAMSAGIFNDLYLADTASRLRTEFTLMTSTGPLIATNTTAHIGVYSVSTPPPQVAVIVKKNTGLGGRRNRGRMYMPNVWFMPESAVDNNGGIGSTHLGNYQDHVDEFFDGLTAASLIPVLCHSDGVGATALTNLSVESLVATQRRRLR